MKAVIYARYSSSSQREESIVVQIRECTKFAEQNGYTILKHYIGKPKISAEFMTFWLQRFRKLDVTQESHRKMLVDTFVSAVYVYDDQLLLTYNFKEGGQTISLADVKAAEKVKSGSDLDCLAAPKRDTP